MDDLETLRILVIDDHEEYANLLKRYLSASHVDIVGGFKKAFELLESACVYDVVILDVILPDASWPQSLKALYGFCPMTAIIVITGALSDEQWYEALQNGAQDYLLKQNTDMKAISRAVLYAVERKKRINSIYEDQKKLQNVISNIRKLLNGKLEIRNESTAR